MDVYALDPPKIIEICVQNSMPGSISTSNIILQLEGRTAMQRQSEMTTRKELSENVVDSESTKIPPMVASFSEKYRKRVDARELAPAASSRMAQSASEWLIQNLVVT